MIGIDEVGRGCWAGPLLVVAYRQRSALPSQLTDSKLLTKQRREQLLEAIVMAGDIGEGWVSAEEIDALGLTGAMQLGVERALLAITAKEDEVIIMDGTINYCQPSYRAVQTVIKADQAHPPVSAASVYAKVTRDRHMAEQAKLYPDFGFEKHVGYGTALHKRQLEQHGPCALHRRSFKPVKAFV